jgi:uncharacterized protein (DUF111 family)
VVRVAYLDLIGGAAGDMILGAFLAAGLPLDELRHTLDLLGLEGTEVSTRRVQRADVPATKLSVGLPGPLGRKHTHSGSPAGPTLSEVDARLAGSRLPEPVAVAASRIFRCLALATSTVSGVPVDRVHFDQQEVVDTYVDVVGAAFALHYFQIARLYSSPLPLWTGELATPRGAISLPHPLTSEIVRMAAVPARGDAEEGTQVTPTGAAILATLADFERPDIAISRRGCGAGDAELAVPNVVKVEIGDLRHPPLDD